MNSIRIAALALSTIVIAAFATGCGNSACQDYLDEISACCDKLSDQPSKDSCKKLVDSVDPDSGDPDACKRAADAYECAVK